MPVRRECRLLGCPSRAVAAANESALSQKPCLGQEAPRKSSRVPRARGFGACQQCTNIRNTSPSCVLRGTACVTHRLTGRPRHFVCRATRPQPTALAHRHSVDRQRTGTGAQRRVGDPSGQNVWGAAPGRRSVSRRGAVSSSSTGCGLSPLHSAKHLEHADEHLEREVPPGAEAPPGGSDAVEPVEPLLEAARVRSRVKGEGAVAVHLARGAGGRVRQQDGAALWEGLGPAAGVVCDAERRRQLVGKLAPPACRPSRTREG